MSPASNLVVSQLCIIVISTNLLVQLESCCVCSSFVGIFCLIQVLGNIHFVGEYDNLVFRSLSSLISITALCSVRIVGVCQENFVGVTIQTNYRVCIQSCSVIYGNNRIITHNLSTLSCIHINCLQVRNRNSKAISGFNQSILICTQFNRSVCLVCNGYLNRIFIQRQTLRKLISELIIIALVVCECRRQRAIQRERNGIANVVVCNVVVVVCQCVVRLLTEINLLILISCVVSVFLYLLHNLRRICLRCYSSCTSNLKHILRNCFASSNASRSFNYQIITRISNINLIAAICISTICNTSCTCREILLEYRSNLIDISIGYPISIIQLCQRFRYCRCSCFACKYICTLNLDVQVRQCFINGFSAYCCWVATICTKCRTPLHICKCDCTIIFRQRTIENLVSLIGMIGFFCRNGNRTRSNRSSRTNRKSRHSSGNDCASCEDGCGCQGCESSCLFHNKNSFLFNFRGCAPAVLPEPPVCIRIYSTRLRYRRLNHR